MLITNVLDQRGQNCLVDDIEVENIDDNHFNGYKQVFIDLLGEISDNLNSSIDEITNINEESYINTETYVSLENLEKNGKTLPKDSLSGEIIQCITQQEICVQNNIIDNKMSDIPEVSEKEICSSSNILPCYSPHVLSYNAKDMNIDIDDSLQVQENENLHHVYNYTSPTVFEQNNIHDIYSDRIILSPESKIVNKLSQHEDFHQNNFDHDPKQGLAQNNFLSFLDHSIIRDNVIPGNTTKFNVLNYQLSNLEKNVNESHILLQVDGIIVDVNFSEEQSVSVVMYVDDKDTLNNLQENINTLGNSLSDIGYKNHQFQFHKQYHDLQKNMISHENEHNDTENLTEAHKVTSSSNLIDILI
ncbi:MAG: hypothetical protein P857_939 [Candidatus Xenolissoclinum pacificiensis L6]|uniref:Uncharacterized protein n=1 Tax=Candidatus Xenolissoclinum pacificiensis L6 TaxID=1401685 RepID=W2V0K4_9RICK|nr:MAG: hypothetical protein P857_939 [Candidatus Xenolissoclinum pacificiensis L6]